MNKKLNVIDQFGPDIDYERVAKTIDVEMCNFALLDCKVEDAKRIYQKSFSGEEFTEEELDSGAMFFFNKKNGSAESETLLTPHGKWFFMAIRKNLFKNNGFKPNLKAFKLLEDRYRVQREKLWKK